MICPYCGTENNDPDHWGYIDRYIDTIGINRTAYHCHGCDSWFEIVSLTKLEIQECLDEKENI